MAVGCGKPWESRDLSQGSMGSGWQADRSSVAGVLDNFGILQEALPYEHVFRNLRRTHNLAESASEFERWSAAGTTPPVITKDADKNPVFTFAAGSSGYSGARAQALDILNQASTVGIRYTIALEVKLSRIPNGASEELRFYCANLPNDSGYRDLSKIPTANEWHRIRVYGTETTSADLHPTFYPNLSLDSDITVSVRKVFVQNTSGRLSPEPDEFVSIEVPTEEKLTNGDFETGDAAGWEVDAAGVATVAGGWCTLTNVSSQSEIWQSFTDLIPGKRYVVGLSVDYDGITGLRFSVNDNVVRHYTGAYLAITISADIDYQFSFTATGTEACFSVWVNSSTVGRKVKFRAAFFGEADHGAGVDGVAYRAFTSPVETDADGIVTETAEVTPITDGMLWLEPLTTNVCHFHHDFDLYGWQPIRCADVNDAVRAPNGKIEANKIVADDTAASTHYVQWGNHTKDAAVEIWTGQVLIKAAELDEVQIWVSNNNSSDSFRQLFNVSTPAAGAAAAIDFTYLGGGVVSGFLDDYVLCWVSGQTLTETELKLHILLAKNGSTVFDGNLVDGLYAWGAQLHEGYGPRLPILSLGSDTTRASDTAYLPTGPLPEAEGAYFIDVVHPEIDPGGHGFAAHGYLAFGNAPQSVGYQNGSYILSYDGAAAASVNNAAVQAGDEQRIAGRWSVSENSANIGRKINSAAWAWDASPATYDGSHYGVSVDQLTLGKNLKFPFGVKGFQVFDKALSLEELEALP